LTDLDVGEEHGCYGGEAHRVFEALRKEQRRVSDGPMLLTLESFTRQIQAFEAEKGDLILIKLYAN
jgi:hypothetical protein